MICSMSDASPDLDVQAYRRSLALQQVQMLTRLAEIGMQLAETEGDHALAAQARAAEPQAEPAAEPAAAPRAEAREAGLAFTRFARSVQRSLALRARAADRLCADDKADAAEREAGRRARRARHQAEVEHVLRDVISEEVADPARAKALQEELEERVWDLYEDPEVRVEDRPLGSVMAGLACGLGLSAEWRLWSPGWPGTPRPLPPSGSPAAVGAERTRRRDIAVTVLERAFTEIEDPTRIPGLRAGLAVRLQEADVIEWLDTETPATVADRLCRSLGLDPYLCRQGPEAPDTG
jgi:hypothetical protein